MNRLTEEVQIGPFAALKDKAEAVPGAFGTYDCFYAHEMAVTRLKKYEDTGLEPEEIVDLRLTWDMYGGEEGITTMLMPPPNPPLTLEELREMDRDPVWVVHPENLFEPCWMLVMLRHNFVMADWQVCDFNTYGKTWLAYRRKPEEETCTAVQPPVPAWAEHFKARFEPEEAQR